MTDVISLETVGIATTVINQGTVGPQGAVGAQGFPGLDGAAGLFVVSVSDSTTVAANSFLLADTSETDAGATYTFPDSPQTGWRVRVLDVGGSVDTKPITVAGNGHDVADGGETRTISEPYRGESFVFEGNLDSWRLEEKVIFSHISATDNPHAVTKTQVGLGNVTDDAQVKRSEMGTANGVPTLGEDGLVPTNQLPPSDSGPWSNPIAATYLSPTSFSVTTDLTGEFSSGVRVKADCGADGLQYGTVESSSYADPTTTVVLTMDDGDALTANLVGVAHGNDDKLSLVSHADVHATGGRDPIITVIASLPAHYARDILGGIAGYTVAEDRRTLLTPNKITCNINDSGFYLAGQQRLDLNLAATWDSTTPDYTVPTNRAGKDFYRYAVNDNGTIRIICSANSTYPSGYTASNSRKIGVFHCLCLSVGSISGHTLTGFLTGDILPASISDILHCSSGDQEGRVYHPVNGGKWGMIYLPSYSGGKLVSVFGGTCADGASSPAFHWYKFSQTFGAQGERMMFQTEFVAFSLGSNQGTNIAGSADPVTTGGHSDTAGRRMISNVGCEDCCGAYSQACEETGAIAGTAEFKNAFDGNDSNVAGQSYQEPSRGRLGGEWNSGVNSGSRSAAWDANPLALMQACSSRGISETLAISL